MGWLPQQPGGLNRYYHGLVHALDREGVAVRGLVTGEAGQGNGLDNQLAIEAFSSGNEPVRQRWRAMSRAFGSALRDDNPQVVASHFALYAYPIARKLKRLPHVVHFHGPWAFEQRWEGDRGVSNWFKRHIERRVYRTADRLITLSDAFAEVLVEEYGVDPDRIRVVPGGIDAAAFEPGVSREEARRVLDWPTDRPIILCVRRLVPRMGLEALVYAMKMLRREHPEALLYIAGKGPLHERLQTRIHEYGLEDHIRLLGFVPDGSLATAYRAADLTIVPTETLEGFGLITLESLAAGTPCLVTPVGGLPEVAEDLDHDLVLEGYQSKDLAAGMRGALEDYCDLPSPAACQAYVREHFDWSVIARRVLEVYDEALQDDADASFGRGPSASTQSGADAHR